MTIKYFAFLALILSTAAFADPPKTTSGAWTSNLTPAQKACYTQNGLDVPEAGKTPQKLPDYETLVKVQKCLGDNGQVPSGKTGK